MRQVNSIIIFRLDKIALMEKDRATRISKYLSLVLRHNPAAAGVTLDAEGWVRVEDLLAGFARHGHSFTRAELEEEVQTSDKQRFILSLDALLLFHKRCMAHRSSPAPIHLKSREMKVKPQIHADKRRSDE